MSWAPCLSAYIEAAGSSTPVSPATCESTSPRVGTSRRPASAARGFGKGGPRPETRGGGGVRGGPVEVPDELGPLPVRVHRGGRVFAPGLRGDLREHVPACRDLEKPRLRGRRFGKGGRELEDAGAERVRVGLGRRAPAGPLLQK